MDPEESFYVEAYYKGKLTNFEIVPNESHFGIMIGNELLGEVQNNEVWEQVSGEELPEYLLDLFFVAIKKHYS